MSSDSHDTEHPSLPSVYQPHFSVTIEAELKRIAAAENDNKTPKSREKLQAVELSRYEPSDPPGPSASVDQWRSTLQQAEVNESYLLERKVNLGLLEKFGKNCWLIGNSSLEDIYTQLQGELSDTRRQLEEVESQRQKKQIAIGGELKALEESWREGIERMLATKAAAEKLRLQLLEHMGKAANA